MKYTGQFRQPLHEYLLALINIGEPVIGVNHLTTISWANGMLILYLQEYMMWGHWSLMEGLFGFQ